MSPGNIILLNGTSSAGKTTLALALQDQMERPHLVTGLDLFIRAFPQRLVVPSDGATPRSAEGWLGVFEDGALARVQIGPFGYKVIAGMYRAIAAIAESGLDVIVDDVIYDPGVLKLAVDLLPATQVFFVGVRLPLEVAERREQERGDRAKGGARAFYDLVHQHGVYDLEIDSSALSVDEAAQRIKDALAARPSTGAFNQLRQALTAGASASL